MRCDNIARAAAPIRPVEYGLAGPGLLALISKFVDHQPLYRQSVINAPDSVVLDRSLRGQSVGHGADLRRPLVDARAGTSLRPRSRMPSIQQYQCSLRVTAGPRLNGSGAMCATAGTQELTSHRSNHSPCNSQGYFRTYSTPCVTSRPVDFCSKVWRAIAISSWCSNAHWYSARNGPIKLRPRSVRS